MNLSSISSAPTAATYGSPAVTATRHVHRRHHDDADAAPTARAPASDAPGRRNPLVAAMMSALKSLMPASAGAPAASTSAATGATAGTATTAAAPTATPAAAPDPSAALREAAYAFAHELFGALRGGGNSGGGRGDDHGGGGNHHHHHRHHRSERSGGYGNLAERLTALAQKLDGTGAAPAPASSAGSGTAATPAAATPVTPPRATPATPATTTTAPVTAPVNATPVTAVASPAPTSVDQSIHLTININLAGTAAAGPVAPPKSAASPLVDAFKKMFDTLNPGASTATGGASAAERLAGFLRQMAQSLKPTESSEPMPTSGSLLNVSA